MKKQMTQLIVIGILVIITFITVRFPSVMISPGATIEAHNHLNENCFTCHTAFGGTPRQKCISCHKVESIGKITIAGEVISPETGKRVAFHQTLVEQNCVSCHSDHNGVMAFRPIRKFSHDLLDPLLQKQCIGCHSKPGDALHLQISGNCGQCHHLDEWVPATFNHDKLFRFDRDHTTDCVTCHINHDYQQYTCYGCHEHSRSGIRKEHFEEGIRNFENCVECHRSGDEDEAKRIWRSKNGGEREDDHD